MRPKELVWRMEMQEYHKKETARKINANSPFCHSGKLDELKIEFSLKNRGEEEKWRKLKPFA